MGGKALKHIEGIRRYAAIEFYTLADSLLPRLEQCLGTQVHLVESYRQKATFGDMDILVLSDGLSDLPERIKKTFEPKGVHSNGNVYSFEHQGLQIDLIKTPLENWETSKVFFAYNDLGNLMGKLYHKFGLKYGFDGVKYLHRIDNTRLLGEVTVTRDMRKAFEFIDLSYDRFLEGFETIEDVFDYVIGSRYFSPKVFSFDNLNAIDKKRNKKRANFALFLQYVNGIGQYSDREPVTKSYEGFHKDKKEYLPEIIQFFGDHLEREFDELNKLEERRVAVASRFNGEMLMKRFPHLTGKKLGQAILRFKESFSTQEDFEDFIIWSSEETLMKRFVNVQVEEDILQEFDDFSRVGTPEEVEERLTAVLGDFVGKPSLEEIREKIKSRVLDELKKWGI